MALQTNGVALMSIRLLCIVGSFLDDKVTYMTKSLPTRSFRLETALVLLSALFFGTMAFAGWEKPAEPQSRAEIVFADSGKWVFDLACSKNIVLFLKYPGKKQTGTATIAISNSKQSILVTGEFDKVHDIDPRDPPFSAAWIGSAPDPADMETVMSILFSGLQLTFTAEGVRYTLPGIDADVIAKYKNDC
jgi:hypothetical protein